LPESAEALPQLHEVGKQSIVSDSWATCGDIQRYLSKVTFSYPMCIWRSLGWPHWYFIDIFGIMQLGS